jgi:hypothetical protein
MGAELFHDETVALCNFANAPKNSESAQKCKYFHNTYR